VFISLLPFRFEIVTPRQAFLEFARTAEYRINSPANFLANIVMFVPIGFLGAGVFVRGETRTRHVVRPAVVLLLAAFSLSSTIEVLQVLLPDRIPSLADIGAQLIGTVIGLAWWRRAAHQLYSWCQGKHPVSK
jgi:VanZ family protein